MRISTTTIESYRLFMQPEQDWMSEQALLDTIAGKFVPNDAVKVGLAFGKIMEDPDRYLVPGGFLCNGFSFSEATMAEPLACIDRRLGVFEAKAQRRYGNCDVVAKADHLVGAHLSEFKTTASTFDFEKYADSCQWRFMVDIFEPQLVTYHIFKVDDHGNGVVDVTDHNTFNLFPYDAIHQDCCELVDAFKGYVTAKGLDGLLRQRQREAA